MKARRRRNEEDLVELHETVRRWRRSFEGNREIVARETWQDGRVMLDRWIPVQRCRLETGFPEHLAEFDRLLRNAPERIHSSDSERERERKLRNLKIRMVAMYDGMIQIWRTIEGELSERLLLAAGMDPSRRDDSRARQGKKTSYCAAHTHGGTKRLQRSQYLRLKAEHGKYDLFLDGFSKEVWRKKGSRPLRPKLRPLHFEMISEYMRERHAIAPHKTRVASLRNQSVSAARKCFEAARRRVERPGRKKPFAVFRTTKTTDGVVSYLFDPPPRFKYCVILPSPESDM